jgi:DNA-binding CsgD family transcriptional regulator
MTGAATGKAHRIWDELAKAPAAEIDHSLKLLLETISESINADLAAWIGTIRFLRGPQAKKDLLSGWRTKAIAFHPPPLPKEAVRARAILKQRTSQPPSMTSIALAREAGEFRIHRLRDGFINFEEFSRTPHYTLYYTDMGISDRLWVGSPVSEEAESFVVFDRRGNGARFTEEDAEFAGYVMRGLTWFQRQVLVSHGLPIVQSPLTAMERKVMQLLLTDMSERQIAEKLGHSPHTAHGHVKQIFRKLGVSTRPELMSIWLSRF